MRLKILETENLAWSRSDKGAKEENESNLIKFNQCHKFIHRFINNVSMNDSTHKISLSQDTRCWMICYFS